MLWMAVASQPACASKDEPAENADVALAESLAGALVAACPLAEPSDDEARAECADALVGVAAFRDHARAPLRWGAQRTAGDYDLARSNTTAFDPFVYRRMYLSTFSFANPLAMLSYPNQALSARHEIVSELEKNAMPPATGESEAGIADDTYRENLRSLAAAFAEVGDLALAFEGERRR